MTGFAAPPAPRADDPALSLLLRVAGGLLVLAATALVAIVESFYVPLRLGTVRLPVSLAIAVACHPLLVWLMRAATGHAWAMLTPFIGWLGLVTVLGMRRADGDLIITGDNWISTALLFGGSVLFVGAIGILFPNASARGTPRPEGGAGR